MRFGPRGIAVRLFLTCWLIYSLHLATNTVREIYLALSLAEHSSFRVDEYAGLHPDLFEKPGYGWHINNSPGASMLGAIPYALGRPVFDRVIALVNQSRAASKAEPPAYDSPWPLARAFFAEAWKRGYDVKFALASLATQVFCMAPISALGVTAMFWFLRRRTGSEGTALWLALIYGFGTPVFFRAGYLNQNMLAGHAAFLGFAALEAFPGRRGKILAGVAGGACLLFDYTGLILLAALGLWAAAAGGSRIRSLAEYAAGALGPVLLLFFYQWRSFGHPFVPAQSWMPRVQWADQGYHGVTGPQAELLFGLAFDYRYGLFTSCPLLLLALFVWRARPYLVERRILLFCALAFVAMYLFSSTVSYARLQFNTGVRYLTAVLPFAFLLAASVLARLPAPAAAFVSVAAVTQAWCMAMYRDVERGLGVLEPVLHVLTGGFQLPALTAAARLGSREYFPFGASPLPLMMLAAALIYLLWSPWLWSRRDEL